MSDGRMLKKAISTSRRLGNLKTDSARMLYTWIIPHLDVEGRFYADPLMIKGSIVPRIKDFGDKKIQDCLTDMADVGLILLYNVDGDTYLQLRKFEDHQNIKKEREAASKIPPPVVTTPEQVPQTPEQVKSSTAQDKIREDKIREDIGTKKQTERPTIEQVKTYCQERKNNVDAQKWFDHYTSNGWMVGKNKMKDWRAAVRTWERSDLTPSKNTPPSPGRDIREYEPVPLPVISDEDRQRNIDRIKGFIAQIGKSP